ncbi:MAG: LytR cell envelope-related transcriptional attenuator [Ilumatobacteraceae bacterium]|nr:LytR cell envelope-related transcriptional attenuator [Ilumatobacteraceae bacterium]
MTAPEARPSGVDSNIRGLAVLAVAIIVGVLLLVSWGDDGSSKVETGSDSTTTTIDTSDLGTTTSSPDAATTTAAGGGGAEHSASEVSVLVLNGSGQTGVAGSTSTTIGEAGYVMKPATNAPAAAETTAVYFAEGYESDAIAVAELLGKGTDTVKPLTEASLGGAEGDADVVVVLGADTPPASDGSTTTTSAG